MLLTYLLTYQAHVMLSHLKISFLGPFPLDFLSLSRPKNHYLILINLYCLWSDSNLLFREFCLTTGCPKKSGALGFKLIMTSRGVFWMWMGFYYSGHLLVHSWAACKCSPPDLILFWTLKYCIETRIIRLVTYPKAPLFWDTLY